MQSRLCSLCNHDQMCYLKFMSDFFQAADSEHQKREKAKARELRGSNWWKQQLGRGICYYCEEKFCPNDLTMDHVLPIARGGKSTKKNVVTACKECNTNKGHRTTFEIALDELKKSPPK